VQKSSGAKSQTNGSVAIVWNAGYFDEYGQACSQWLSKCGWQTATFDSFEGTSDFDIVLVVGISFYRYLPFRPGQLWVGVQSEQMPLEGDTDWSLHRNLKRYFGLSRYYDLIIEWSPANLLRNLRPDRVRYLPYGCEYQEASLSAKKYDILFLGNPVGSNNRRGKLLDKLKKRYNVCQIHSAWRDQKHELIEQSRICLNLHQFDSRSFESPRLFELLAAGAFVLSEDIENSFPFTAGRDYLEFRNEQELTEVLDYYLKDEQARSEIARSGQSITRHYTFAQVFGVLSIELQRIQRHRRSFLKRLADWIGASLSMAKIDFVDWLASIKRRLRKH
jgi:hypothetical protein